MSYLLIKNEIFFFPKRELTIKSSKNESRSLKIERLSREKDCMVKSVHEDISFSRTKSSYLRDTRLLSSRVHKNNIVLSLSVIENNIGLSLTVICLIHLYVRWSSIKDFMYTGNCFSNKIWSKLKQFFVEY